MYLLAPSSDSSTWGERLPKGVIPRLHLYIFPPTTTKTCINSWLEVITPTGKRWEISLKLALNKSNYPNNGGISSKEWHSCWVYGPYLFSLPTKGRPTQASNREINQKLLTLLEQPSCLTASHGELENRVFPWVFVHHEPIRRCHLRSRDSRGFSTK